MKGPPKRPAAASPLPGAPPADGKPGPRGPLNMSFRALGWCYGRRCRRFCADPLPKATICVPTILRRVGALAVGINLVAALPTRRGVSDRVDEQHHSAVVLHPSAAGGPWWRSPSPPACLTTAGPRRGSMIDHDLRPPGIGSCTPASRTANIGGAPFAQRGHRKGLPWRAVGVEPTSRHPARRVASTPASATRPGAQHAAVRRGAQAATEAGDLEHVRSRLKCRLTSTPMAFSIPI